MSRVEFYQPAGTVDVPGKGEFEDRYAPDAFDGCVGKEVPFKIKGVERGQATVVAVRVDEDGRGATWTVDIEGGDPARAAEAWAGRFSFRLPDEE